MAARGVEHLRAASRRPSPAAARPAPHAACRAARAGCRPRRCPTSSTVCGTVRPASRRSSARSGRRRPPSQRLTRREVAQVAAQGGRVVERAVEQLLDPRETAHQPWNRVGVSHGEEEQSRGARSAARRRTRTASQAEPRVGGIRGTASAPATHACWASPRPRGGGERDDERDGERAERPGDGRRARLASAPGVAPGACVTARTRRGRCPVMTRTLAGTTTQQPPPRGAPPTPGTGSRVDHPRGTGVAGPVRAPRIAVEDAGARRSRWSTTRMIAVPNASQPERLHRRRIPSAGAGDAARDP